MAVRLSAGEHTVAGAAGGLPEACLGGPMVARTGQGSDVMELDARERLLEAMDRLTANKLDRIL